MKTRTTTSAPVAQVAQATTNAQVTQVAQVAKRVVTMAALFAIALLASFGLAGCTLPSFLSHSDAEAAADVDNLVIVYTATKNNPQADATKIESELTKVAEAKREVAVVVADGEPWVALQPTVIGSDDASAKSRELQNASTCANLTGQVLGLAARTDEVDLLGALSLTNRLASGMNGATKVLVVGSGLSTAGLVQYQNGLLDMDIKDLLDYYSEAGVELPTLSAPTSIEWMYMGDVAGAQDSLSDGQVSKLKEQWTTLLTACGAPEVTFDADIPNGNECESECSVTAIPVGELVAFGQAASETSVGLPDNETFGFVPGTAQLLDSEAATVTLQTEFEEHPEARTASVTVTGRTATLSTSQSDIDYCQQLGLERAQAIAGILVDLGFDPQSIACESVGCSLNTGDSYDLDGSGRQIPDKAQANRIVEISWS